MHKVQAGYANAKSEMMSLLRLRKYLIDSPEIPIEVSVKTETLISKCEPKVFRAIDNLLEWASAHNPAIGIAIGLIKEASDESDERRKLVWDLTHDMCEFAMSIPVVTRGETD